jgi:flagellar operon protein
MVKVDMQQIIQQTKVNNDYQSPKTQNVIKNGPSFEEVLAQVKKDESGVKFSKHASQRLEERNIVLSRGDLNKITNAIEKAEGKGIKDALIIMDNKQFVANIKNKTVITASTNEQLREQVFTNIDGAVIV